MFVSLPSSVFFFKAASRAGNAASVPVYGRTVLACMRPHCSLSQALERPLVYIVHMRCDNERGAFIYILSL